MWRILAILFAIVLALGLATGAVAEPDRIGVLLMHGKQGGGARDTSLDTLHQKLLAQGWIVLRPEMPWSVNRYIEGDWSQAMAEMDAHVRKLREMGATKVAVMGHSLGSPAAMSYAVRYPGQVQALALLAPGHVPLHYSQCIPYSPIPMCGVKESIERARREVAAGKGDERQTLVDINQGRRGPIWMTPRQFLTYFDPASDAEMAVTAPRIPPRVAVLWVIGDKDYLIREGRAYVFDKLPANPRNRYLEVSANHLTTPAVAADAVVEWTRQTLQD